MSRDWFTNNEMDAADELAQAQLRETLEANARRPQAEAASKPRKVLAADPEVKAVSEGVNAPHD